MYKLGVNMVNKATNNTVQDLPKYIKKAADMALWKSTLFPPQPSYHRDSKKTYNHGLWESV